MCVDCPLGFFCPGTGDAVACPENSTTTITGWSLPICICMAGFYTVPDTSLCQPCQRGKYKPNVGNSDCSLACPGNADSDLGSAGLADCFCQPGFHAKIDAATGMLARCAACEYQGLVCPGGFEGANLTSLTNESLPRVHAQPVAELLGCVWTQAGSPAPTVARLRAPSCAGRASSKPVRPLPWRVQ